MTAMGTFAGRESPAMTPRTTPMNKRTFVVVDAPAGGGVMEVVKLNHPLILKDGRWI